MLSTKSNITKITKIVKSTMGVDISSQLSVADVDTETGTSQGTSESPLSIPTYNSHANHPPRGNTGRNDNGRQSKKGMLQVNKKPKPK